MLGFSSYASTLNNGGDVFLYEKLYNPRRLGFSNFVHVGSFVTCSGDDSEVVSTRTGVEAQARDIEQCFNECMDGKPDSTCDYVSYALNDNGASGQCILYYGAGSCKTRVPTDTMEHLYRRVKTRARLHESDFIELQKGHGHLSASFRTKVYPPDHLLRYFSEPKIVWLVESEIDSNLRWPDPDSTNIFHCMKMCLETTSCASILFSVSEPRAACTMMGVSYSELSRSKPVSESIPASAKAYEVSDRILENSLEYDYSRCEESGPCSVPGECDRDHRCRTWMYYYLRCDQSLI